MVAIEAALVNPNRSAILEIWSKMDNRLRSGDLDGSITTAKTLIEAICKLALKETKTDFNENMELTKLYSLSAKALGMSAANETAQSLKSIFGATATLVRTLAELRNQAGDAHGKADGTIKLPFWQAELAVNMAGSVAVFMITAIDAYVRASRSIDLSGRVVLKFDKSRVWRLYDHARNARKSLRSYGQKKSEPGLWLVGDAGIYLMSNGSPPMAPDGSIFKSIDGQPAPRMTALASGCDPMIDALEDWWVIHNAIDDGNDFSITIPTENFSEALASSDRQIVLIIEADQINVLSDIDFHSQAAN